MKRSQAMIIKAQDPKWKRRYGAMFPDRKTLWFKSRATAKKHVDAYNREKGVA